MKRLTLSAQIKVPGQLKAYLDVCTAAAFADASNAIKWKTIFSVYDTHINWIESTLFHFNSEDKSETQKKTIKDFALRASEARREVSK